MVEIMDASVDEGGGAVPPVKIDLGGILWDLVEAGKYEEALEEVKSEKYKQFVISNSMDLIPVLTLKLQDSSDFAAQECLESIMVHVASVGKVKEVMIVLLEEVQTFKSQEVYRVMLKPMQAALNRLVSTKCSPTLFTWTFKSIIEHLGKMELPTGYNLEGKERLLLDADPSVQALSENIFQVLQFFKGFYQSIILGKLIFTSKIPNTKIFFAKTLLRLFDKPLAFLDVYRFQKDNENTIYRATVKFVSIIMRLNGNPIKLFNEIVSQKSIVSDSSFTEDQPSKAKNENADDTKDDGDYDLTNTVSQTSLATLFYCIFHQHMSIDMVPCVYHPQYKFLTCLPLISQLLAKTEHLAIHKGVLLTESLVVHIDEQSVCAECLEAPSHFYFNKLFVGTMTMVDNKEIRTTAFNVFRKYISNFDYNGRYRLFESLLQSVTHAGVLGFIVTEIKENIVATCNENVHVTDNKFSGRYLWNLIYLSCTLPDGERTDMLDWSDKILSILNLLLFMFIRGIKICASQELSVEENATFSASKFPEHVEHFQNELFTPLQRGLQISREHYELNLKGITQTLELSKSGQMDVEFSVGDSIMPGMSPEQERDVMRLALSRFDLINCVLAQVEAAARELLSTCRRMQDQAAPESGYNNFTISK